MKNTYRMTKTTVAIDLRNKQGEVVAVTFIDRADWDLVKDRTWSINKGGYVCTYGRGGGKENMYLHRLICGTHKTQRWTDHRNGDRLDNRRSNLRSVTARQSNINKRTKRGELRGITPTQTGRWLAQISLTFDTAEEARKWRDEVVKLIHTPAFIEGSLNMD